MASFPLLPAFLRHCPLWRISLSFLIILTAPISLFSQPVGSAEKAEELYNQHAYSEAIELYENADPDLAAVEHLAASYRLNHDTENAEIWYGRLVQQKTEPINYLHYAQMLHCNGNFERAKEFYLKYAETSTNYYDNRGGILAAAIDQLTASAPKAVSIQNIGTINSPYLDFSPVFYKNGIVFASTREASHSNSASVDSWTGEGFSKLYFSEKQTDGNYSHPSEFFDGLAIRHHQGPLSFFPDGSAFLFTNNIAMKADNGEKEYFLKITKAVKDGRLWLKDGEPDLGTGIWNDAHPAITADGQYLFFASDRPGGYGGMDIYMTKRYSGKWGFPINLGPEINTPGNEVFPFVHSDGTLYFASNGWGGYGGLDIFYSEKNIDGFWKQAGNIGLPFNSAKDDFGYIIDLTGTSGFFTSARKGGTGKDDIYEFTLPSPQSNKLTLQPNSTICLLDEMTGERLAGAKVNVFSKIADGAFIGFENEYMVKMVASAINGEYEKEWLQPDPFGQLEMKTTEFQTDEDGQINLFLERSKLYLFSVQKAGYVPANIEYFAGSPTSCFSLKPSNCVNVTGRLTNKQDESGIGGASISLVNLNNGWEIETNTDHSGAYGVCVERGVDYIIKAEKAGFVDGNAIVSTINLTSDRGQVHRDLQLSHVIRPANDTPTEEGLFAEGILIELEHIYYDYGQSEIRPDAAKELDIIVQFMRRHPNLSVELRSHTDSRGEDDFNRMLSQKRAQAAVTYLMMKGISKNRLTAIGLGEDELLNNCDDGEDCPEATHQINRRTEVKFFFNDK